MYEDQDELSALDDLDAPGSGFVDAQDPREDNELRAAFSQELEDAVSFIDTEIGPERAEATRFYQALPYGDEEEGRSQIVTTEVRDTVRAMLPGLMRTFTGASKVVEFLPTNAENVEFAAQATDTVHFVFMRQNDGFRILWDVFKDALVRKVGFMKWWWDDSRRASYRTFSNVTEDQLLAIQDELGQAGEVEILETVDDVEARQVEEGGPEEPVPTRYYKVRVKEVKAYGCARVCAVPPEEVGFDRNARTLQTARLVFHRSMKPRDELIAMGITEEQLNDAGAGSSDLESNEEAIARQPGVSSLMVHAGANDESGDKFEFVEGWWRRDVDGDGIVELNHVWCLGSAQNIVRLEPCNEVCLEGFAFDPESHVVIGLSAADYTMDLQLIGSHVMRDTLDAVKSSLFPRMGIVEGQVNIDDVLNTDLGAPIRMRVQGAVQPFDIPFSGDKVYPLMERLDRVRERRVGINDATAGLNGSELQSTTRDAAMSSVQASQQQQELTARIFASALSRVFAGIHRLLVDNQDRKMTVSLRGREFITVNPSHWDPEMQCEPVVALGAGSDEVKLDRYGAIVAEQKEIMASLGPDNPIAGLQEYANTLRKMAEFAQIRDTDSYFKDPAAALAEAAAKAEQEGPQEPPPTPEQILAQVEFAKTEQKRENDERAHDLRMLELLMVDDRERDKFEAEVMLRAYEISARTGAQVDTAEIKAMMDRQRNDIRRQQLQAKLAPAAAAPQ